MPHRGHVVCVVVAGRRSVDAPPLPGGEVRVEAVVAVEAELHPEHPAGHPEQPEHQVERPAPSKEQTHIEQSLRRRAVSQPVQPPHCLGGGDWVAVPKGLHPLRPNGCHRSKVR
jgi:hypothetical protein